MVCLSGCVRPRGGVFVRLSGLRVVYLSGLGVVCLSGCLRPRGGVFVRLSQA